MDHSPEGAMLLQRKVLTSAPKLALIRLKRISLIILNTRLVQELIVFILPVSAMMVLGLVADVLCNSVQTSVIHRESAIARLPAKAFVILFVQRLDPLAAVSLDALHEVGKGDGLGQGGEDVDMVADAPDFHRDAVHIADETADVGEHLPEVLVAYLHAMVFYVEDEVDVVFCE